MSLRLASHLRLAVLGSILFASTACTTPVISAERHDNVACVLSSEERLQASKSSGSDLGIHIEGTDESVRLVDSTNVSGPCAGDIIGSKMGAFALRSGQGFQIGSDGRIQDQPSALAAVAPASLSTETVPNLNGATFVQAVVIGARRENQMLTRHYLGLWRDNGRWIIADFHQPEAGEPSPPRAILSSSLSVSGISYLPSPDANIGRMTIVQTLSPTSARILDYDTKF